MSGDGWKLHKCCGLRMPTAQHKRLMRIEDDPEVAPDLLLSILRHANGQPAQFGDVHDACETGRFLLAHEWKVRGRVWHVARIATELEPQKSLAAEVKRLRLMVACVGGLVNEALMPE